MEFIWGGNIFLKLFNRPIQNDSDFEGRKFSRKFHPRESTGVSRRFKSVRPNVTQKGSCAPEIFYLMLLFFRLF